MGFWSKKRLIMLNKESIKYYLIPAGIFVIIILIILIVPMGNKKTSTTPSQFPTPTGVQAPDRFQPPTPLVSEAPSTGSSPTLIPPHFTGVDSSQVFPPEMIRLSEQKTELRRKAPLEMSFGTISFDYGNDTFIVSLKEPKNESQIAFNTWIKEMYPALTLDQFAFQ